MSNKEAERQEQIIFASIVFPSKTSETNALLLAESIRAFSGSLSQFPVWYFTPKGGTNLSYTFRDKLHALDVTLIPFGIDPNVAEFPFTSHAHGAALAELKASSRTDLLAWLSANTLVLREPGEFLLQEGKCLGYRPVHHTLIGSQYDEALNPFWKSIYQYCQVPDDRVFPMMTHVDNETLRPYFNAGCLIIKPEKHLLRDWRDAFVKVYQEPPFPELYLQDKRYKIFLHQAVLSGVILSTLATDEIIELPTTYNYPLHLYDEDVTGSRPSSLEELVTARHEGFYEDPEWFKKMPAKEPLKKWIAERLL
jgi:hypothetical protein